MTAQVFVAVLRKLNKFGSLCKELPYLELEKALRAFASSSGGAACPGATRGQPQGSTPGVRG